MKSALFIDFDDSFSFNVVQELVEIGLKVRVLNWIDFENEPAEDLLVLGPGPGHPDDYQKIFPIIEKWLKREKPFFGVCLGHQIFWRLHGGAVQKSLHPQHGQKILLDLSEDWRQWLGLRGEVWVQRYNSLAVMRQDKECPVSVNLTQNNEILMTRGDHFITYQFHPESVGTSFRKAFFLPITRDLV